MKRILILVGVMTLLAGLYISSPFVAAWRMREAVKLGNVAYLTEKVDWEPVRASLKASIKRHAILAEEVAEHGKVTPPTMWQRVKLAFGQPMVDSFVDRYVTPTGLPQLYRMKSTYATTVRGEPDETKFGLWERMTRFAKRIKRAEFQSPTVVEIELADKVNAKRRYVSRMELVGAEWKLTGLEVKASSAGASPGEGLSPVDGRSGDAPQKFLESRINATPRLR
jgi:hypothetical protein